MNSTPQVDLVFLGGSFDPPHVGHKECVQIALKHFPKAQVLVIPALQPAVAKDQPEKSPQASFTHRLYLCKLLIKDLDKARVQVSDIERELPTPNYTLRTIDKLQELYPGKTLGMLIGSDQWRVFKSWHKPEEILKRALVVVLARGGEETPSDAPKFISERITDVKSTWLREQLAADKRVDPTLLPQELQDYIFSHGLYRPLC